MTPFWIGFQISIVFLETFIRLKVTSSKRRQRRVGYACGIAAQFFWLAVFLKFHQYYLLPLLIIDGTIWAHGLCKACQPKHRDPEYYI